MQSGGQSAGIQLQVGLDLAFFRKQLPSLGTAAAGYSLPIKIHFDRGSITESLRKLGNSLGNKTYNITVQDTNLDIVVKKVDTLADKLKKLSTSINIGLDAGGVAGGTPGTAIKVMAKKLADQFKDDIGAAARTMENMRGAAPFGAGARSIPGFKAAAQGMGIENAFKLFFQELKQVDPQRLAKVLDDGSTMMMRENAEFKQGLDAIQNKAKKLASDLGAMGDAAKLTGKAFIEDGGKVLRPQNYGLKIASLLSSIEKLDSDLRKASVETGVDLLGALNDLSSVLRSASNSFVKIAGLSDTLDDTLRGFDTAAKQASRATSAYAERIQRRSGGAAMATAGPPLLPGSRGGALAVQTASFDPYRVITAQVREGFDIIEDYHKRQLNSFISDYKKIIDQYHRNILIAAARQQVRNVRVSELAQRPTQGMLSGTRIAGLLSPEPAGRYRGDRMEEAQSRLFARREREARMRSALRGAGLGQHFTERPRLPGTTFMGDDFTRGGGRDRVTGSGQPPQRGGALAFPGGGMGPSSQLGAGYFAVGKGIDAMKKSYMGVEKFLNTSKVPLAGAIGKLGAEFGTAVKQVLLYGTAYKALAFFTDLPNQAFGATKALATYRNQLQAVTSESRTFDQSLAFVDNLAQRFNVPLDSAREGFIKLYASMQPVGFGQEQIENLFTGISKAAAAFGLSADKVDRVNYAFAQMASKGQIMSEELKGQLGDVLPGAMGLFAQAAQMSIPEFSKAMEDGAFKGKAMVQVLDNVAILMNSKFGPAATGAAKTLQGAVNQIQNNLKLMYESFGPLVNRFAAIFGPQVNNLIKDVASTMNVLTGTFTVAGEGFATLSPRAQAFYAAIQSSKLPLQQAGAAIADLGSRFAALLPAIVQAIAASISFASSPLGRGAIMAAVAIGTLTAAIKLLEASGLKAAIKSVYLFIGGLLKIPPASGAARLALIGLKLALTGLVVGAILMGLDILIGKLFNIGDAANNSAKDIRGMRKELDAMAGAGDIESTSKVFLDANTKLAAARKENQKALTALRDAKARPEGDTQADINKGVAVANAQTKVNQTYAKVIEAQRDLQAARQSRASAVALKERQEKETQGTLQKIDLLGGDTTKKKKQESLESYYSLQDTLAKNFTQAEIDRLEAEHQRKVDLIKAEYDLKELRANSFQKDALKFERRMAEITLERQGALLKASNAVLAAQGSVAGGASGGGKGLGAGIAQYITGDPSSPFYRGDHGGSNYHEHLAFVSREAAEEAYRKLTSAGVQVTEFKGKSPVGRHTPGSAHYEGLAFDVPGAQVPVGKERELTARVQSILGIGGTSGAGAARKVPGSEKRDIVADQKMQLEQVKQSAIARQAEAKAIEDAEIALADFVATATPVEEQKLQNDLLKRRTELMMQGYSDSAIDQAMKFAEAEYKVNFALKLNDELEKKGVRTKAEADVIRKQMTEGLTAYSSALAENTIRLRDNQLVQAMTVLKDRMAMARAMTPDQELREQIRQKYSDLPPEQQEGLFQQEKLVQGAEKLKADMQGIASSIGDAFGNAFKGIITGSMTAREALAGFFQSVADSFADMVAKMIAEWLRAQLIQGFMSIFGPIAGGLGGGGSVLGGNSSAVFGLNTPDMNQYSPLLPMANGGVLSGGFRAFANGGIVKGPTLGLVGEGRYNEAVIPLPDGKSVPVDLGGAAGNIQSSIVINIDGNGNVNSDSSGSNASDFGRKIEGAVKQAIVNELRPGGVLSGRR